MYCLQNIMMRSSSSTASLKGYTFLLLEDMSFDLNQKIKFKPAVLFKIVSGSPISELIFLQISVFNEKFTLGASYQFRCSS